MAQPSFEDLIDQIQLPSPSQPSQPTQDRSMAGKFMDEVDRTTPQMGPTPEFMDRLDRSPLPPVRFRQVDTSVPSSTATNAPPPPVRSIRRPAPSFPPIPPSEPVMPQEIERANVQGAGPAGQYERPSSAGEILGDVFWNRPEFKVLPQVTPQAIRNAARDFVGASVPQLPTGEVAGPEISTDQVPPTKLEQLGTGYANSINNTLNWFTGSQGILTSAIPGLPAWMQRLVAAGFAYALGKNVN